METVAEEPEDGAEPVAPPSPELWAAVGNIKRICWKGTGLSEAHPGTKHFRGGAKVFVVSAFWGVTGIVTVIGQHRKSRRWLCIHMRSIHLEQLRPKVVYHPVVRRLMLEQAYALWTALPGQEYVEQLCAAISVWNQDKEAHAIEVRLRCGIDTVRVPSTEPATSDSDLASEPTT